MTTRRQAIDEGFEQLMIDIENYSGDRGRMYATWNRCVSLVVDIVTRADIDDYVAVHFRERTADALEDAGIFTLRELAEMTYDELLTMPRIAEATALNVKLKMNSLGFPLRRKETAKVAAGDGMQQVFRFE